MIKKLENLSNNLNKDGFLKEAGVIDDILSTISKALSESEQGKKSDDDESSESSPEESEGEQIEFEEEDTQNFDICPGAVKAFKFLREKVDSDSRDIALEALRDTDKLLGIERGSIDSGAASLEDFKEVVELAQRVAYKSGVLSNMIDEELDDHFVFLNMHIEKMADLVK